MTCASCVALERPCWRHASIAEAGPIVGIIRGQPVHAAPVFCAWKFSPTSPTCGHSRECKCHELGHEFTEPELP